ncbi:MAG: hypothetical protein IPK83_00600 [Planctomycetes bacterium]|nr:hypothetical protein [Planctomycetota bacterium]
MRWFESVVNAILSLLIGAGAVAFDYLRDATRSYGVPGLLSFTVHAPEMNFTIEEGIRSPFAALAVVVHGLASDPTMQVYLFVALSFLVLAVAVIGAVLMPLFAAGERLSSLYPRCLKLTLWSLTMLLPMAIWLTYWPGLRAAMGQPEAANEDTMVLGTSTPSYLMFDSFDIVAISILGAWWLFVLVRSGLDYAGPMEGPAWEPQRPICRKCGYVLAGLQLDGNCPECNASNEESIKLQLRGLKFTHWNAFRLAFRAAVRH